MPHRKIATCCYCGTRAALVLAGRERHELACANCGAPLHNLKMLRTDHEEKHPGLIKPSRIRTSPAPGPQRKKRKDKRRKTLKRKIFEEAWDILEDIFD